MSPHIQTSLGQPLVFDNRPGANFRLGLEALKKSPGDAHILTISQDVQIVTQPLADPKFQTEMGKDYVPVAFLAESPMVMVASPSATFRDIKGMIAYAKENPGKLNFAVTAGASSHFLTERLRQTAVIDVVTVPYKGAPPLILDLAAGRVDLTITASSAASFINSGKIVGMATTGSRRWQIFPDLPTFEESGVPMASTLWFGLLAPSRTPTDVVSKLNTAFLQALHQPEVIKLLEGFGYNARAVNSPAEFASFIQSEIRIWGPVIRQSGIKIE
jgi:tripartite-type tricarboxylate transporter receptor subunit TctC